MSDSYYDDILWRALCNHETYQGGRHKDKLEKYLKKVIDEYKDIAECATGWKKLLWKNGPVYLEIPNPEETCRFTSGFGNITISEGMVLTHANSCTCGFFSMSNGQEKKCPLCNNTLTTVLLGSDKYQYYKECACGVRNDINNDVCDDCGTDALEIKQGRQIGKKANIEYVDIFTPPQEIEREFFEELLALFLYVDLFIQDEMEKEDLHDQWMKMYKMILKRDLEMAHPGNPGKAVKNFCKRHGVV